jgi:hypothetical protein
MYEPVRRLFFEAVVIHLLRDHRRDQPAQHLDELPLLLGVYRALAGGLQMDAQLAGVRLGHGFKAEIENDACPPVLSRWIVTSPGDGARKRRSPPVDEPNVPEGVSVSMSAAPLVRALTRQSDPGVR